MFEKAKYVSIIVVVGLIDQLTKAWVLENLQGKPPIVLWQNATTGQVWFELSFTTNTGAAWGIFAGHTEYLAALSAVMIVVMGWVLVQARKDEVLLSVALSMMLGGAFGNLLDRMIHKFVTDFLHCYLPIGGFVQWLADTTKIPALVKWHAEMIHNGVYDFPIFNVADSAVVVGTCLLLIALMRPTPDAEPQIDSESALQAESLAIAIVPDPAPSSSVAAARSEDAPEEAASAPPSAEDPIPAEQPS